MVLGQTVVGETGLLPFTRPRPTPLPEHIGVSDVKQFIAGTAELRALDRQYGGAGVERAIAAYACRGEQLLPLASSDIIHQQMAAALADCYLLAGWASFDAGHPEKGRHHFHNALTFCEIAGESDITASVLYTIARMEIDSGEPNEGLKHLQLASMGAAPDSMWRQFIEADMGRAYAAMGIEKRARDAIERTTYQLPGEHNTADLMGVTSATYASLHHYQDAAVILHDLLPQRKKSAARAVAGELTRLATVCLEMGEIDQGLAAGKHALRAVNMVPGSLRTMQRLAPLRQAALKRKDSSCQDFAQMVGKRLAV